MISLYALGSLTTDGEEFDAVKALCKQAGTLSDFILSDVVFQFRGLAMEAESN